MSGSLRRESMACKLGTRIIHYSVFVGYNAAVSVCRCLCMMLPLLRSYWCSTETLNYLTFSDLFQYNQCLASRVQLSLHFDPHVSSLTEHRFCQYNIVKPIKYTRVDH